MKREEAIYCLKAQSERYSEVCEECPLYGQTGVNHCCEDALQMAITALQNQPVWIPVSERLPEESLNSVIGWDTYRNRCCFVQYLGGRFVLGDDNDSVNVTAWMPLPEPYQGSEPHKQTNADRIRSMTDEELAMAIMCPAEFTGSDKVCDFSHDCKDCTLAWLQKESEEQ
jgi:hypothetical protein